VQVSWRPSPTPEGLTARYTISRLDADDPQAQPVLLTPQAVEGDLLPPTSEQLAAKQNAERLVVEVVVARKAMSAAAGAQRDELEAAYNAKRAELRQARLQAGSRRGWIDTSARLDAKYRYIVRAVFLPSNLESDDSISSIVSVPSPAPPPRVQGARFAGFTATAQLPAEQRADDSPKIPGSVTRARLAPNPAGFKVAANDGPSRFSISRPLRSAGSPAPQRSTAARPPQAGLVGGLAGGQLSPRIPVLGIETLSRLAVNLGKTRDDGGVVKLEWTAVPLRDVTYRIRRRAGQEAFVDVGAASPNMAAYRDVVPRSKARTYEYQVVPVSRWGIAGEPTASIAAAVPSTLRASQPNILAAAPDAEVDRAIRVRFAPNAAEESVFAYRILRDGAVAGEVTAAAQQGELFFLDKGREPRKTHRYTIIAVNPVGASEESRPVSADALQLTVAAPANSKAAADPRGVAISWTAVPGCTYTIQRKSGAAPFVIVAGNLRAPTATHLDASAIAGVSYTYDITAMDSIGNISDPATVTIKP
jgi:hypothetical protein